MCTNIFSHSQSILRYIEGYIKRMDRTKSWHLFKLVVYLGIVAEEIGFKKMAWGFSCISFFYTSPSSHTLSFFSYHFITNSNTQRLRVYRRVNVWANHEREKKFRIYMTVSNTRKSHEFNNIQCEIRISFTTLENSDQFHRCWKCCNSSLFAICSVIICVNPSICQANEFGVTISWLFISFHEFVELLWAM